MTLINPVHNDISENISVYNDCTQTLRRSRTILRFLFMCLNYILRDYTEVISIHTGTVQMLIAFYSY
jgi:hypothetical protein